MEGGGLVQEAVMICSPPQNTPSPKARADTAHRACLQSCDHAAPPPKGRETVLGAQNGRIQLGGGGPLQMGQVWGLILIQRGGPLLYRGEGQVWGPILREGPLLYGGGGPLVQRGAQDRGTHPRAVSQRQQGGSVGTTAIVWRVLRYHRGPVDDTAGEGAPPVSTGTTMATRVLPIQQGGEPGQYSKGGAVWAFHRSLRNEQTRRYYSPPSVWPPHRYQCAELPHRHQRAVPQEGKHDTGGGTRPLRGNT